MSKFYLCLGKTDDIEQNQSRYGAHSEGPLLHPAAVLHFTATTPAPKAALG